jgi:hypothetical protein
MLPSLILGALALAIVLFLLLRGREEGRAGAKRQEGSSAATKGKAGPRPGTCTLCGSVLLPGEHMKSDIFPGSGPRMMRIFGCVHCLGSRAETLPRWCPVCGGELGPDDYGIARYFESPGRRHVHVLGCTRCRERLKETVHGR